MKGADVYDRIREYVRDFFEKNDPYATSSKVKYPFRNRFEHTMRVYRWALRICEKEKGDSDVVKAAALFHDTGKVFREREEPHALISARICRDYLEENGFDRKFIDRVVSAVANHSSKNRDAGELLLEDRILIDADLLDEAGALAVLWDSMAVAMKKNPSYHKVYTRHKQYYEALKDQRAYLKTGNGRRFFDERLAFLHEFIINLEYELG